MTIEAPAPGALEATIWGSRGGVSVQGEAFTRYGGMTTCLELRTAEGRLVVDAGSGFAAMGREAPLGDGSLRLLVSHMHWDHIVGLPHYAPLFSGAAKVEVHGVPRDGVTALEGVVNMHRPPVFPVPVGELVKANVRGFELEESGTDSYAGIAYSWIEGQHPGGCSCFRFTWGSSSLVFLTDIEIAELPDDTVLDFSRGADILIVDAQYTADEYPSRVGWGHSTNIQAAEFAGRAEVGRLVMTHHDAGRCDEDVDRMAAQARRVFAETVAARDRMQFTLTR